VPVTDDIPDHVLFPELPRHRRLAILGCTGSIGTQALEVVGANPDRFAVAALSAGGSNLDLLLQQVLAWRPTLVAVSDASAASDFRDRLAVAWPDGVSRPDVVDGPDGAAHAASVDCDIVLNAVAGAQGLRATLAALAAGRVVALANKESLIAGGPLVLDAARPGQLVPVDS